MLSPEYIQSENRKAAIRAAHQNKQPFVIYPEDFKTFPPFPFPNFGDYRPKNWELVEELFVDSSGFGQDYEIAMSVNQFLDYLKDHVTDGYGYAIISAGQFQVYVGVFKKV